MLYYNRIDISEEIDVNKTNESKEECGICHCWYFLNKDFKFQMYAYNGCHDLLLMSINLDDIVISNINGIDFQCNINGVNKSEATNLLKNADLTEKSTTLSKLVFVYHIKKWIKKL